MAGEKRTILITGGAGFIGGPQTPAQRLVIL